MKKSYLALAALGVLIISSCSNEQIEYASGNDDNVTFDISLPSNTLSRAYAEADFAKTLHYAAYESGSMTPVINETKPMTGLTDKVTMTLVKGKTYDFIFWADRTTDSPYAFAAEGRTVTVSYDGAAVNDDTRDAFFQTVKDVTITGPMEDKVELRRPFAQINVGTNDIAEAAAVGVEVKNTSITVDGAYTSLDLYTGVASNPVTVEFAAAASATDETFPVVKENENFTYLAMAYVLTGTEIEADVQKAQSELFNISVDINCEDGHNINLPLDNAPVQRNYRTNIFGALLTSPFDWNIEIKPQPETPDYNLTQNISEGVYLNNNGEYLLTSPAAISWLAEQVNTGATNFSKKTLKLAADIDLSGVELEPIGYDPNKAFFGNFDGQGHTISNLSMTNPTYHSVGLFGRLSNGTIKNVKLANVTIENAYVNSGAAALVGSVYPSGRVENCEIDGGNISANRRIGGMTGYTYGHVQDCTAKNLVVTAIPEAVGSGYDNGDKAGAITGMLCESSYTFKNNHVINVTVSAYRDLGSVVGHAASPVIGCSATKSKVSFYELPAGAAMVDGAKSSNIGPIIGRYATDKEKCIDNSSTEVIVGEEIVPGLSFVDDTNTYGVSTPEGLVALTEQPIPAKATVELYGDIDLAGQPTPNFRAWHPETPNAFDGNGHTIKNMVLDENNKDFITEWVGPIKNLTIDGVEGTVTNRFAGLLGNVYGDIENIHIKNVKLTTSDGRIGAIVGIHNSGAMRNCSIENVEVIGAWSVGGMIGCINETEGGRVYENLSVKNVKVVNTKAFGGVYDYMVGLIVGNINLAGVEFKNCTIEGCDSNLPIYHSYFDYIWNGETIKADIDEDGNTME